MVRDYAFLPGIGTIEKSSKPYSLPAVERKSHEVTATEA